MAKTRHNAGRMVVSKFAEEQNIALRHDKAFHALVGKDRSLFVLLPETCMNDSGRAVAAISRYYEIAPEETVVAVDCMAFALGELKLQPKGGAGGHNGLTDIERMIGPNYMRLRIGIGQAPFSFEDHVLGPFKAEELDKLPIQKAVEALQRLTRENFANVATDINTKRQTMPITEDKK